MGDDRLSFERLIERGWVLNVNKGVQTTRFTSVSLCLVRDGYRLHCVQGYGPTRAEAIIDATSEANDWLVQQANPLKTIDFDLTR